MFIIQEFLSWVGQDRFIILGFIFNVSGTYKVNQGNKKHLYWFNDYAAVSLTMLLRVFQTVATYIFDTAASYWKLLLRL